MAAIIVVDLQPGDAGKGSTVDWLTWLYQATVNFRFNGGPQAAHNVVTVDGRHHTFSQFGSGTLQHAPTLLSRHSLVDLLALEKEAEHLETLGIAVPLHKLAVDYRAPIITPFQTAANRLKELSRGDSRHGSCGKGIGETVQDLVTYGTAMLTIGDLLKPHITLAKLRFIQELKLTEVAELAKKLTRTKQVLNELMWLESTNVTSLLVEEYYRLARLVNIVDQEGINELFNHSALIVAEGAQGIQLDETYGFYPYTTWSDTTPTNAYGVLAESKYNEGTTVLGLLRGYWTRHGAGPFVSEDIGLTYRLTEPHNGTNPWQGKFRVGYFDVVAAQYAIEIAKPQVLGITMLDRMREIPKWKICIAYRYIGNPSDLDGYFDHDGSIIKLIIVLPNPSLVHQERCGQLMQNCQPLYEDLRLPTGSKMDSMKYVHVLEAKLGIPVAVASFGPTIADKQLLQPLM